MFIILKEKHEKLESRGMQEHPKLKWVNGEPFLLDYNPLGGWGQTVDYETAEDLIGMHALKWISTSGVDHDSADLWYDIQNFFNKSKYTPESILDAVIKATDWMDYQ